MKILLAGPVEGYMNVLFADAKKEEAHWIVCAGDFGIWPDPQRMDRASKKYAATDFSKRYVGANPSPITIPVLTVAGSHDDNRWLNHRQSANNTEILNNVHWLAQGYRTTIGFDEPEGIRVTGIGRAYSEATFNGDRGKKSHRHYTRRDVERACSSGPTDLLVLYEHLDSPGLRNVIYATRPKLIVTVSQVNRKVYDAVQDTPVVTLDRYDTKVVEWKNGQFCV
jgi:hypothetical protein